MTSPVSAAYPTARVAAGELGSRSDRVRERDDSSSARTESRDDRATAPADDPNAAEAVASAFRDGPKTVLSEGRSIEFSFDRDSNRVVVKVTSDDDGEVIRQIPPEQYLNFSNRLSDMAGVLFDERG